MAHHIKEWDVPDCPKCGTEYKTYMRYIEGTQTRDNPFGRKEYFMACPECGHERKESEVTNG